MKIFNPDGMVARSELENGLLAAAWREFDCEPLAATSGRAEDRRREQKRAKIADTTSRFVAAMRSSSPPATEADAIAELAPVGAWLLSWLFRQMVIQVIKFLWRKMHDTTCGQYDSKVD